MLKKNDVVKVNVSAISNEGIGICKYTKDELRDFVIYVPFTAAGDVIECRILKTLSSYAFGKIESIITSSPDRCEPDCAAFGKCGGCCYRHINYGAELMCKKAAAEYAFRRVFGENMPTVNDTEASPMQRGYRNKVQFPITPDGKCGFYAKNSHRTVNTENCALQNKAFAPIVKAFEKWIAECKIPPYSEETKEGVLRHLYMRYGESGVCVCVVATVKKLPCEAELVDIMSRTENVASLYLNTNRDNTNVILGKEYRLLYGDEYISDTLCGIKMRISPQSFYQVNKQQAERLYAKALEKAGLDKNSKVLDLYCGIGGITMAAAKLAGSAVGVEIVPEAIEDAKRIAAENNIENVRFFTSDANRLKELLKKADFMPDTVIVDPPRKGLDEITVKALAELMPEKIVYISCNPQTQARDIRDINAAANEAYAVSDVTPFDMFPATAHVETVVLLSKI